MENQSKRGIPFKEFLDKSTNLLTIFGILNALFIYFMSIKDINQNAASFLLPTFFLLGILVWFELIILALNSNDGSFKYELFYLFACCIQIGLIWYFVLFFASLLAQLATLGLFFLYFYLIATFFMWLIKKMKLHLKFKPSNLVFIGFLVAAPFVVFIQIKSVNFINKGIDKVVSSKNKVEQVTNSRDNGADSTKNIINLKGI